MKRVHRLCRHVVASECTSTPTSSVVLPLYVSQHVLFPSIRHDVQLKTEAERAAVSEALDITGGELVVCRDQVIGQYGTRAVVQRYDEADGSATLLCTQRCVVTAARGQTHIEVRSAPDVLCENQAELVCHVHELLFELHSECQFLDTEPARTFLQSLRQSNPDSDIPFEPVALSWFMAEVLPFSESQRESLLKEDSAPNRLHAAVAMIQYLLSGDSAALLQQPLRPGDSVVCKGELGVVLEVHLGDPGGEYVTLRMGDGREKQTVPARVQRISGAEVPPAIAEFGDLPDNVD